MQNIEKVLDSFSNELESYENVKIVIPNIGRVITFYIDFQDKETSDKSRKMLVKYSHILNTRTAISCEKKYIIFIFPSEEFAQMVRQRIEQE